MSDLIPSNSIHQALFGDLGLVNGEWPVCGELPDWERSQWPMPDFSRQDDASGSTWVVKRSDLDPSVVETEYLAKQDPTMLRDSLFGYGAIEIVLTKLLSASNPNEAVLQRSDIPSKLPDEVNKNLIVDHYLYFPDDEIAKLVASHLTCLGFTVECRLGADDVNWLVLVRQLVVSSKHGVDETADILRGFAAANSGEYDGWESNCGNDQTFRD